MRTEIIEIGEISWQGVKFNSVTILGSLTWMSSMNNLKVPLFKTVGPKSADKQCGPVIYGIRVALRRNRGAY